MKWHAGSVYALTAVFSPHGNTDVVSVHGTELLSCCPNARYRHGNRREMTLTISNHCLILNFKRDFMTANRDPIKISYRAFRLSVLFTERKAAPFSVLSLRGGVVADGASADSESAGKRKSDVQ